MLGQLSLQRWASIRWAGTTVGLSVVFVESDQSADGSAAAGVCVDRLLLVDWNFFTKVRENPPEVLRFPFNR